MPNWKAAIEALFKKEDEDEISKIINNIILDKISNIEIKIKDKDEDMKEHMKAIKSLISFNRKDVDELIQIIQSHYIETKQNKTKNEEMKNISKNTINILMKYTENQKNQIDNLKYNIEDLESNMKNLEKQNEIMKQQIDVLYKIITKKE